MKPWSLIFMLILGAQSLVAFGQTLVIGVDELLEHFQPFQSGRVSRSSLLALLHRTLVKEDERGTIVADLARSWHASKDFREFDFCVEKAQFSDTRAVSYDDVVYSLQRIISYKKVEFFSFYLIDNQAVFRQLQPAANTSFCFSVTFKNPVPNFIYMLAHGFFSIVPQNSTGKTAIGAGPYRLKSFDAEKHTMELELKEAYANYAVKNFIVREVYDESPAILLKKIEDSDIDLYLDFFDFQNEPSKKSRHHIEFLNNMEISHGLYNISRPILKDAAFRKDLKALFWFCAQNHGIKGLNHQRYLMPVGIMFPNYYHRDLAVPADFPDVFVKRWKGRVHGDTLRLFSQFDTFSPQFLATLTSTLQAIGVKLDLHPRVNAAEQAAFKTYDFDIYMTILTGFGRRSDQFLYLFNHYTFQTKEAKILLKPRIEKVASILNEMDNAIRTRRLADAIIEIEDLNLHIPLFSVSQPIVLKSGLKLRSAQFGKFINLVDIAKNGLLHEGI